MKCNEYGLTPQEFHEGVEALWEALDVNVFSEEMGTRREKDVFSFAIKQLKYFKNMWDEEGKPTQRNPLRESNMCGIGGDR